MARPQTHVKPAPTSTASARAASEDERLDEALDDTFPASDPVTLKPPRREAAGLPAREVKLDEDALPPEKPA